jgi:hypothetical protein
MLRFYTHIDNGNGHFRDDEGALYPDVEAARSQAIRTAASIIGDELIRDGPTVEITLYIEDEHHKEVAKLPISAVLRGEGGV